jgi:hypothetical protein
VSAASPHTTPVSTAPDYGRPRRWRLRRREERFATNAQRYATDPCWPGDWRSHPHPHHRRLDCDYGRCEGAVRADQRSRTCLPERAGLVTRNEDGDGAPGPRWGPDCRQPDPHVPVPGPRQDCTTDAWTAHSGSSRNLVGPERTGAASCSRPPARTTPAANARAFIAGPWNWTSARITTRPPAPSARRIPLTLGHSCDGELKATVVVLIFSGPVVGECQKFLRSG